MPHRSIMRPPTAVLTEDRGRRGLSSRHFLKLIEDSIDIGLWSASIDSDQLQGSVGLYRVLGLDPAVDLTFGLLAEMMHPDDRRIHASLLDLLRSGQAVQREFRIIRPDRTQRWVSSRAEVILGPDDQPTYALGIIKDVTGRHEAQRSVELEHDRFTALLNATAAMVWIAAPNGRVHDLSQWRELTGQTQQQVQEGGWLTAIHPDDRERTRAAWETAVSHTMPYNTDYRVLCRDEVYRWFNARAVPIQNQDGSVREWIGLCLNIAGQNRPQTQTQIVPECPPGSSVEQALMPAQIRAARALIDMSAEELAQRARIGASTVLRLENKDSPRQARRETMLAIRQVLEQAGVEFISAPKPGVRMA